MNILPGGAMGGYFDAMGSTSTLPAGESLTALMWERAVLYKSQMEARSATCKY